MQLALASLHIFCIQKRGAAASLSSPERSVALASVSEREVLQLPLYLLLLVGDYQAD